MREHRSYWSIPSTLPGVAWPPVSSSQSARVLAMQFSLEQSQWLAPERILAQQFQQLRLLVRHALATTPYYRQRWPQGVQPETLNLEQWRALPLLTRQDLREAGPALLSSQPLPEHGALKEVRTSGSTGVPVEVRKSRFDDFMWKALTLRDHHWHGRDLGGRLAVIRYMFNQDKRSPAGFRQAGWGAATAGVLPTGPSAGLHILTPLTEMVGWLQRENPQVLMTHPSVLRELASHFRAHGLLLPHLREVRTIAETVPDDLRGLCRQVWNVPLTDAYSAQEHGYLALQCPHYPHYHVQAENVLLEVLDEAGRPCAPGDTGRVVATSLHNFATPLLRYEIGDLATVGEPCPCGRGLPVLAKILGRYRNLVTLPDGTRRWPLATVMLFPSPVAIHQVQMVQHSLTRIEVRLVADGPLPPETQAQLRRYIQDNLGHPFELDLIPVERIERSGSGKHEEFISLL